MKRLLVVDDDRTTRHLLRGVLRSAGFDVVTAKDGADALRALGKQNFNLMLLDVWMPRMNGMELLAKLRGRKRVPKVIVMTTDGTPETVLQAIREQAYHYVSKPFQAPQLVEMVRNALETSAQAPIEVISARPEWVELLVPCSIEAAERIQNFLAHLDAHLPEEVRAQVGQVFREMLSNAIEWGGRFDPNRKVRISSVRTERMVLYRIADPGPGFKFEELPHAAVSYSKEQPLEHTRVREEKGLRPGGFGILIARAMVDELIYNEKHNEVLFIKYLDAKMRATGGQ